MFNKDYQIAFNSADGSLETAHIFALEFFDDRIFMASDYIRANGEVECCHDDYCFDFGNHEHSKEMVRNEVVVNVTAGIDTGCSVTVEEKNVNVYKRVDLSRSQDVDDITYFFNTSYFVISSDGVYYAIKFETDTLTGGCKHFTEASADLDYLIHMVAHDINETIDELERSNIAVTIEGDGSRFFRF